MLILFSSIPFIQRIELIVYGGCFCTACPLGQKFMRPKQLFSLYTVAVPVKIFDENVDF